MELTPIQNVNSFGVPQGPVLGPLLFSLYYGPLEDVVRAHCIDAMMYADDSQLYIIIKRSSRRVALHQFELCIDDVLCCNTQNGLKCIPTKTEVIHFYSRFTPSDSISQNKFDSKAGTTARAIETLMGQYFD